MRTYHTSRECLQQYLGSVDGLSGRCPLSRKGCRRLILQRAVRSQEVVVLLPASQLLPHILEREEHFHIQTLITETPIETLDEAILDGLAGPNKVQLNTVAVGPGIHDATSKFAPVVHGDGSRRSPLSDHRLQRLRHLLPCERLVGDQTQAFPRELVHDGQDPKPSPIRHTLVHEVHAPPLVRRRGHGLRHAVSSCRSHTDFGPHHQTLFRVQPIDPLRVHPPPIPSQQHRESSIAETHPARGHLSQTYLQRLLRITMPLIPQRGPRHRQQPRDPALTDLIGRLRPAGQHTPVPRPYSFFRTISCSRCRSSERSATSRFSLVFSSRTCRNSRSSLSPSPAYLRFHV